MLGKGQNWPSRLCFWHPAESSVTLLPEIVLVKRTPCVCVSPETLNHGKPSKQIKEIHPRRSHHTHTHTHSSLSLCSAAVIGRLVYVTRMCSGYYWMGNSSNRSRKHSLLFWASLNSIMTGLCVCVCVSVHAKRHRVKYVDLTQYTLGVNCIIRLTLRGKQLLYSAATSFWNKYYYKTDSSGPWRWLVNSGVLFMMKHGYDRFTEQICVLLHNTLSNVTKQYTIKIVLCFSYNVFIIY